MTGSDCRHIDNHMGGRKKDDGRGWRKSTISMTGSMPLRSIPKDEDAYFLAEKLTDGMRIDITGVRAV